MNREYLPSKTFMIRIGILLAIVVVVFGVYKITSYLKKNKILKKETPAQIQVKDVAQKDSNSNGIADWEEYLWGLDPNKNGPENKEFIVAKKKTLQENGESSIADDSKSITDNELLSKQFFATIVSLQQTGQLDEASMKTVSEAVGKNIEATPIPDIYTNNMLSVRTDSSTAKKTYRDALSNLITKYTDADIGSELTLIIQGLSNNDPQALYAAKTVGDSYQSFGKEFIKIPVPKSLASEHLSAANNYEKVGQSIQDLSQILSDPMIGMRAIVGYKNYSDKLANDLEKISEILQ